MLSELLQSSPVSAFNPLLRLCSIGSPLTRYNMCLFAAAIVHARSRHVSTRVRCSSVRLVVSRWRHFDLLSPPSRFLSTSCSLSVGSSSVSSLLSATSSSRSASIIPEVVKFLTKSWARDEERANVVAVCYHLTSVAADEKLSTNPAQVVATYTETLKYQDVLKTPDRVFWKVVLALEYHTLDKMHC